MEATSPATSAHEPPIVANNLAILRPSGEVDGSVVMLRLVKHLENLVDMICRVCHLVECIVECVVEDTPTSLQVQNLLLTLRIDVAESVAWHGVVQVIPLTFRVRDGHSLAHYGRTANDIDQIDLIRTKEVFRPVCHRGGKIARICVESTGLSDAVVDFLTTNVSSIPGILRVDLMLAKAVEQLLAAKAVGKKQDGRTIWTLDRKSVV